MPEEKKRDIKAASLRQEVEEEKEKKNRHGLVIGIDEYQNKNLNLDYASNDAKEIYKLMVDPECGMFAENNVELLLNEEATERNIKRAFSQARREVGEQDTFWFYYAGHGAPEGNKTYWLPHDADANDLWATGISNSYIKELLEVLPAERKVLFLDCCYAVATSMKDNSTRSNLGGEELIKEFDATGTVTIASSDTDEKSVELTEYEQGAFTYYLKKGLKGEADIKEDGVVTLEELWEYLPRKVQEAARKAGNSRHLY